MIRTNVKPFIRYSVFIRSKKPTQPKHKDLSRSSLMASLGSLPEEVMIEILSRLPPESLVRFKCVRKSWYALVNNPKFVAKHLVNSLKQRNVPDSSATILVKRLVIKDYGRKENIFSFFTYPDACDRSVVDIDLPFFEDSPSLEIRGHCHGIVCLSDLRSDIVLCNPATREFRQLPPSILLLTEPPEEPDGYDSSTNAVGFGYDSKSKDFKVVRVVNFVEGPGYFYPPKVEVYDLSTDRWRVIDTPVCGHVFWAPSFEMYYRGIYYWWADTEGGREIIQSFDMSEEVFRPIPVPESFEDLRENYRSMGVWNGSIVLFHYPSTGDEKTFDIWVMEKDESGEVSWSKPLRIGPVSGIEKPLLFVNSDELLMEASEGQLVSYNINTQEFKDLPVKGQPARFQATSFTKSLLSVKGGNKLDPGVASQII